MQLQTWEHQRWNHLRHFAHDENVQQKNNDKRKVSPEVANNSNRGRKHAERPPQGILRTVFGK